MTLPARAVAERRRSVASARAYDLTTNEETQQPLDKRDQQPPGKQKTRN